jgi:RNA polymerase sigma-70 factor, ECF subfamily
LNNDPAYSKDLFLLGQIARREEAAFCELFDQRAPAILGVLSRLLDKAQAEEVLIEVFAEVWEEAPRFHPNGTSPFSWMLQLARDRAAERLRSARRVSDPPSEDRGNLGKTLVRSLP